MTQLTRPLDHSDPTADAVTDPAPDGPEPGWPRRLRAGARASAPGLGWALLAIALLVATWQVVKSVSGLPDVTLPGPVAVARETWEERSVLWPNALVTLREILAGYAVAVGIGLVLAVAMAFSRIADRLLTPMLVISHAVPKIAVAPVLLIWFGFGATLNVTIAAVVAVFPVTINAILGLKGIDPDFVHLGQIMGGNGWRLFWRMRVPLALPSTFAGLKTAMTLATIGAIVGELVGGQEGLGYLAQFAAGRLDTTLTFASVVATAALGVVLYYTVVLVEMRVLRWHPSVHGGRR